MAIDYEKIRKRMEEARKASQGYKVGTNTALAQMLGLDTAKELLDLKYSRDGSYQFTASDGSIISNTYKIYTGVIKK